MITIRVNTNFAGVQKYLQATQKQIAFASAIALTKTAKQAESELRVEMTRVFKNPTPYALGATRVIPATPARQVAQVWLKDRRGQPQGKDANFLFPEVFGGRRGRKAFETRLLREGVLRSNEFVVPAKALPLDSYGNVPTGLIRTILSQLQAAGGREQRVGYESNARKDSARSLRTVAKRGTIFVSRGKSTGNPLPRGIYRRIKTGFGWATQMIFKIVEGRPAYKPVLRMFEIGRRVQARDFARNFDIEMRRPKPVRR